MTNNTAEKIDKIVLVTSAIVVISSIVLLFESVHGRDEEIASECESSGGTFVHATQPIHLCLQLHIAVMSPHQRQREQGRLLIAAEATLRDQVCTIQRLEHPNMFWDSGNPETTRESVDDVLTSKIDCCELCP